jgi:hypothetical protein
VAKEGGRSGDIRTGCSLGIEGQPHCFSSFKPLIQTHSQPNAPSICMYNWRTYSNRRRTGQGFENIDAVFADVYLECTLQINEPQLQRSKHQCATERLSTSTMSG